MAGKPAFLKDLEVDEETKKNHPNKPFKQTKQLIKLALNDGWSQVDIGKVCRVSQPVISNWKNGAALAKEHQIQTLLEQYGHILRRKTFKVYWVVDEKTQESSYIRVEGKVIFSYILRKICRSRSNSEKEIYTPSTKVVVHHQGGNLFRLVLQARSKFNHGEDLMCMDEEAHWTTYLKEQMSSDEIIKWIESWAKKFESELPPDAKALPFLIRKALLNHGFPVEDVVEYPAAW
jgi:hypothetical protein